MSVLTKLVVALALAQVAMAPAPASPALPAADDLMAKMVWRARQEVQTDVGHGYGATIHATGEQLEESGRVKTHHEWQLEPVLIEGEVYARIVLEDGRPLSAKGRAEEAKREREFREYVRKRQVEPPFVDARLVSRFRIDVVRLEEVDGHPAWLVTLFPKPEQPPARSREEKVLGHMQGKIWIDAVRFSLVRGELDLVEPVSVGFGASVSAAHLEFESAMVAPSLWLMRHYALDFSARGLFDAARVRRNKDYSDFRLLSR